MARLTCLFVLALVTLTSVNAAKNVTRIEDCPALTPRNGPRDVHDLRPDDIKVVGALGDSITAGFGIMGYNITLPSPIALLDSFTEYRGLSYSGGGQEGAFTVPNYIKHYQPSLTGYSNGNHTLHSCSANNCSVSYTAQDDQLNAALSGAIAKNLDRQLDYMIQEMKVITELDFDNDWKMINIQIGSNDMCNSCEQNEVNYTTPESYGNYVNAAIDRIQQNIPKVLVNLIGTFNVSQIFPLTANQTYCSPMTTNVRVNYNLGECNCAGVPGGLEKMDQLSADYNKRLYDIYEKHQQNKSADFAVVYQQANLNITSFPIDFFSNLDCFHPGLKGHRWVSKIVWNQLFSNQAMKPRIFNFNESQTIYCPIDSDRIVTN
ncbi:uncharacterized protein B0P05DRAFT_567136 [Gilbertella persicaria]|uniref:Phospholipase B1, membrane-associated n=1 Tax=Rhizopus stolonifer TaxID=4846 RepID=A0A367IW28_RHIST|nr:uncharacterized protein B0P05DRAFT_567136 [Gilbertella persicaria]KAI8047025.1 hypothetical protein B0P05DRAFT_567136 [Gilbertella persicaria]RCH81877.1 hypothetical protein CU098_003226 [Rhizopus stolonifer]